MAVSTKAAPLLLTGATSSTGQRVARRLLEAGANVRCLIRTPSHRDRLPDHPSLDIIQGSADSPEDLARAVEDVATVLHVAHIRFAPAIVKALSDRPSPTRLVALSSTRLLSKYATAVRRAVRRGEEAITKAPPHVRWTILRPTMIFGDRRDNNIERIARALRRSRFFPLFGRGDNLVQPLFVCDLVEAILACLERPESVSRAYILAGPEPIAYREMVSTVARAAGLRRPVFVRVPSKPSYLAARAVRAVWPRSPLDPEMIQRFGEDRPFNTFPARHDLGFEPTPFETALERKFRGDV